MSHNKPPFLRHRPVFSIMVLSCVLILVGIVSSQLLDITIGHPDNPLIAVLLQVILGVSIAVALAVLIGLTGFLVLWMWSRSDRAVKHEAPQDPPLQASMNVTSQQLHPTATRRRATKIIRFPTGYHQKVRPR